jgi:hypothetical protein
MFSSPAAYPSNLPQSIVQQQQQSQYTPQPFAGASNPATFVPPPSQTPYNNYNPNLNPSPQMQTQQPPQQLPQPQVQQAAPMGFPAGGVGGMDYSELEKLLGPEQLKLILGGI